MKFAEEQLKKIDLTDDVAFEAIKDFMHENILFSRFPQILETDDFFAQWWGVWPDFKEKFPDKASEIELLLVESRWIGLPVMKNEVVLDLFKNHLTVLFNVQEHHEIPDDVDVVTEYLSERLREKLTGLLSFDMRDKFKKELVQALTTSDTVITSAPFYRGIKTEQPTVKYWFSEYMEHLPDEEYNKVKRKSFFSNNQNVKVLSKLEKNRLEAIVKMFEQIKISSWKEQGIEEEVYYEDEKGSGVLQYGQVHYDDKKVITEYQDTMKKIDELLTESETTDSRGALGRTGKRPPVQQVTSGPTKNFTTPSTGADIASTEGPDYFTDKDSADIDSHTEQGAEFIPGPTNYVAQAKELISSVQVTFTAPEQEKQFINLVGSVFRGLRDTMELISYLEDLDYNEEMIDTIVSTVKKMKSSKKVPTSAAQAAQPLSSVGHKAKGQASGIVDEPAPNEAVVQPETERESAASTKKAFLPKLRRARRTKKQMIDDVKLRQSMVMGPIEELRSMDLIEFRRLSADPAIAAQKLKAKIELLVEESISKEADGIQAFKESPLNQKYLEIGNLSMSSGQSVDEIIAEAEAKQEPTLSQTEFNIVADLNHEIRF